MSQVKTDGIKNELNRIKKNLSEVIHSCVMESPACNWGFRGMHGDEVKLNYKIRIKG